MKTYRVGVLGATGMVGQRFLTLLEQHPWFEVTVLGSLLSFGREKLSGCSRKKVGYVW